VPPDAAFLAVGSHHHGHGVPADQALDAPFDLAAAGEGKLLFSRDGVDVGRIGREGQFDARLLGVNAQFVQETRDALGPAALQHVVQRLQPFPGFNRFELGRLFVCRVVHSCVTLLSKE